MAEPFKVNLVAVEKSVWSGDASMVIARTVDGELAVLAGHAPLLGQLVDPSQLRIRNGEGKTFSYTVGGGFFAISSDGVTVLAETAEEDDKSAAGQRD